MTHDLDAEEHPAGDSLEYVLSVTDPETGNAKDLRGGTARWALLSRDKTEVVYDHDDVGFGVEISDGENGEVTATLEAEATNGLEGTHYQRFLIYDGGGKRRTYMGKLVFEENGPIE